MLKRNLFYLGALFLISGTSLALIVSNVNPYQANNSVIALFYLSSLVFVWTILAVILFSIKYYLRKNQMWEEQIKSSLRQAFFFSSAAVLVIFFNSLELLDIWVAVPVFLVAFLLELFFQTKK